MNNTLKVTLVNKIISLQDVIKNVIRENQRYKTNGLIKINDLNSCVVFGESIYYKLKKILVELNATDKNMDKNTNSETITAIQNCINEISTLISLYGCDNLDTLIKICLGINYKNEEKHVDKYKLLNKYFSPLRYKIVQWNKSEIYSKNDENIVKNSDNFDCFDNDLSFLEFPNQIYGIKTVIHNIEKKQTIVVYGVLEDSLLNLLDNTLIEERLNDLKTNQPTKEPNYNTKTFDRFISCLSLKDLLIYSTKTLIERYVTCVDDFEKKINKKSLPQIIDDFIEQDLFDKRSTLITLLVNSYENESQYLAYLLYDLLSNDIHGMIDTYEQTVIYDSLPYSVKKYFREAMTHIITYTNKLSKIDVSKISLEQRICLMKTDDCVKEKAMVKLKEVKLKAEDNGSGSKAMQFLEGLLKIPFGIYKEEQILKMMPEIISVFNNLIRSITNSEIHIKSQLSLPFPQKTHYTGVEIYKYLPLLKNTYKKEMVAFMIATFKTSTATMPKNTIITTYTYLKKLLLQFADVSYPLINYRSKPLDELRNQLVADVDNLLKIEKVKDSLIKEWSLKESASNSEGIAQLNTTLVAIENKIHAINTFMQNMADTLNLSVYGHTKAKRQIERIIGQWINGDLTGYCFGFEGPPGVGKTSLAKNGIAKCLKDDAGVARPFAFIAMGGSANSSTLDGHNYTYVGSSWGRIVDILMDTKIMNPIFFIDELDKVSKTENGKEIIGILMHLIDQTQNDTFQDKYFNGINLNLSKALFIFSYNDAELIDRILLDRIHRIQFEHLTNADKLVISRKYILPDIYKKMGLIDMIDMSDEVIEFIIENYTAEPGVRKLKELMFEIIGEINLFILKSFETQTPDMALPMVITLNDIKYKYLKEQREINAMKIHGKSIVGVINGLWANSAGKGGVLPIEASFFPSGSFLDLKLTGMQGDVMKESMTVAKSLAWSLFARDCEEAAKLQHKLEKNKNQGLHIHVPEGATPKDGPSAGTAITMVMYSLFSDKKIKNNVAITGEICLQGRVTAIGGLDLKILGGIKAGVKTFIYPEDNKKDFTEFMEKYSTKISLEDIQFVAVGTIDEVMAIIFE